MEIKAKEKKNENTISQLSHGKDKSKSNHFRTKKKRKMETIKDLKNKMKTHHNLKNKRETESIKVPLWDQNTWVGPSICFIK